MLNEVRAHFKGRRLWLLAVPAIAIGSVVAATTAWNGEEASSEPAPRILPVEVLQVEPAEDAVAARFYTGTVAARRTSKVGFERSARVVRVDVDEGDVVRSGQRLASLDVRDLELRRAQVQAQRAEAQARLQELEAGPRWEVIAAARARRDELAERRKLAEARVERRGELLQRQAISKEEFDVVAYELGSLRAAEQAAAHQLDELVAGTRQEQVLTQRAVVEQLSASLAVIDLDLERSVLRAPYAGRVSQRLVDEGTFVEPGQPVVAIVEHVAPEVRIGVPVDVARIFEPGDRHRVAVGERYWDATVASRLPELDPRTRTLTVLFRLPAGASTQVLPGEVGRLELERSLDVTGHWLPTGALTKGVRGLWACYALEAAPDAGANAFELARRDVEVLYTADDRVLVRGTLSAGDRIVRSGINRISAGQLVRPANN